MSGPCLQHVNESTSTQATYNIETLNQHHEEYDQNNEDRTARGILASSFPEAAEAPVLPVPDGQPNNKLEGNEVDEHSCSYDAEFLNREASNLHKDVCVDPFSEDSHRSHLPPLRSPQRSAYFHNEKDPGSVGTISLLTCSHLSTRCAAQFFSSTCSAFPIRNLSKQQARRCRRTPR
jgi:hypothetical protein